MKKILTLFMATLILLTLAGFVSADVAQDECAPMDVVLVIDRSGSMIQVNKLENAKTSAKNFVDLLEMDDFSALTYYSYDAVRDVALTDIKQDVKDGISALVPDEGALTQQTCIRCGVQEGQAELDQNSRNDVVKAMILLTDGKPTRPSDSPALSEMAAQDAKDKGTLLFTIGIGDVNGTLLTNMATQPDYYYYDADSTDLDTIYEEIAGELCIPTDEEIPEFGTVAAGVALVGAIAGFFVLRRRD